jgi:hypothetical protein
MTSTRRFSTRRVKFPAISIRVPRLVEIHRERKSGWYERFTEYVESAESSRQASRVSVISSGKFFL